VGVQFAVAGALALQTNGVRIDDRAFGGPQPRLVVAMLLVDRDRPWSPEQLAAQLWPSGRPERWRPAVRGLVSRLRSLLAEVGVDEVVTSRAGHYHVDLADLSVDLEVAHEEVVHAVAALRDGRHAEADELAGRARAVLSRPILAGLDAPWVEELRHVVAADHVESLLLLGRARRGQRRWAAARSVLAEALGRAPFREDAWRDLMQLEATSGNTATALQVYEDCRRQLADELGVDPSPATQALHTDILRGIPVPAQVPAGHVPSSSARPPASEHDGADGAHGADDVRSPYVGLRPFEQADADRFFGRDAAVQRLVDLLADHVTVTVVGPSGSGKSSVVRAGLVPALAAGAIPDADTWPIAIAVPGRQPLRALASVLVGVADEGDGSEAVADLVDRLAEDPSELHVEASRVLAAIGADPAARIVLVVDQAEELFTVAEPEQATALLAAVTAAVRRRDPRLAMVATMRADVYAEAASNPDMAALLGRSQLVIPPMSGAELEAAVVGPASLVGATLERGIVGRIVDDATGQPGRLPLLQHTLWELWHHRDGATLTLGGYDRIGGLAGALARHAEQTWDALDDQALARRILLRGVAPGTREEADSRRPIHRADLDGMADPDDLLAVLETLVSSRLLQAQARDDDVVYELAHEALLREWPRLRGWIEADRTAIVAAQQLSDAAASWEALDRDPGALYRGTKLDVALEQLGGRIDTLPDTARAFLDASQAARDRQREAEAERVARQARTNRRLRRQLAAVAVAMIIAVAGGLVALDQRRRAQDEERVAVARELAAESVAVVDEDPELGILLALEAVEQTRATDRSVLPEAEEALHRAVTASRIVLSVPDLGGSVAWHPDGAVFVTEGPEESGVVDLRDTQTGASVLSFTGHDADINDVAFSPDGSLLATTGDDGLLRVWDPDTGDLQRELSAGNEQVWAPSFSPDGTRVAAAWVNDGTVRILDLTTDERPLTIPAWTPNLADSMSFSPNGQQLAIADESGVVVVDAITGDRNLEFQPGTNPQYGQALAVAWSPDGRWIASSSPGAEMWITDADSGERHIGLAGHEGEVERIDWSPDGSRLATGSRDGTTRVWEVTDGGATEQITLAAREGAVGGVAFSPDGEQLLTGDLRVNAARIWDVGIAGGAEWANLPTSPNTSGMATFTPDGDSVVVTGDGTSAVVWDPVAMVPQRRLGEDTSNAWEIDVNPDGDLVATVGMDEPPRVQVWDRRSGDLVFTVQDDGFYPEIVAWSPDGELLAAAGFHDGRQAGKIMIVDRSGRQVTEVVEDIDHAPRHVEFSPDGEQLITQRTRLRRDDPTADGVRVWDWAQGEALIDLPVFAEVVAVGPAGARAAVGEVTRGGSIWDLETGERLATLTGHNGDVFDVAFSPDGDTVATAGTDGTARLWNTESGTERLVLHSDEGPVSSVAFSPDGDRLATTSVGVARVWALDLDDLIGIAEDRLTRSLTDDECRQYLHVEVCPE
jgi:WD40 repeat protein/DNA-binding SARP family transcriptional activator